MTAWTITFDCADALPAAELADGAAIEDPDGVAPQISFLTVPEPKTAKNRIHLDVRVGSGRRQPVAQRWPPVQAKAQQLVAAGATVLAEHELNGEPDHLVLADPEGNEFCVI